MLEQQIKAIASLVKERHHLYRAFSCSEKLIGALAQKESIGGMEVMVVTHPDQVLRPGIREPHPMMEPYFFVVDSRKYEPPQELVHVARQEFYGAKLRSDARLAYIAEHERFSFPTALQLRSVTLDTSNDYLINKAIEGTL